jgi:opacity protein-like surface antigen
MKDEIMKKNLVSLALASTLMLLTGTSIGGTEGETYVGAQYAVSEYNEDGISEEFEPTLWLLRVGRFFTPNLAIEGRLGSGLDDDTRSVPELGGNDGTLEIEDILGIYAIGHLNLTESASIYGVLGASKVEGTASVPSFPGLESTEDNSSISFGVGADFGIGSNVTLNIEYLRYLDDSDYDLDAVAGGAVYSF